jgi:hypothetical protein
MTGTTCRIERGAHLLDRLQQLRQAFERKELTALLRVTLRAARVDFIDENGGGAGVRLQNRLSANHELIDAYSTRTFEVHRDITQNHALALCFPRSRACI